MQEILHEVWEAAIMRLVKRACSWTSIFVINCLYQPYKTEFGEQTMKTLKAICTAAILALALSVPAYAGDIETPGKPCPVTSGSNTPDITPEPAVIVSALDTDIGLPALADIMWALASVF